LRSGDRVTFGTLDAQPTPIATNVRREGRKEAA
jgi:hypothetical protein